MNPDKISLEGNQQREPVREALSSFLAFRVIYLTLIATVLLLTAGCGNSPSDPPEAVFLGSSTVSKWDLSQSFPGKNYVNKGVKDDNTAGMLARFPSDVVKLKPQVVVIWAGENDIEQGIALSTTQANILAMLQQATKDGIRVVFCTAQPKTGSQVDENPAIVQFNEWLGSFAASNGVQLADFYAVLVDANGMLNANYAVGTEELNSAGYAAITPVAAAAIAAAEK